MFFVDQDWSIIGVECEWTSVLLKGETRFAAGIIETDRYNVTVAEHRVNVAASLPPSRAAT